MRITFETQSGQLLAALQGDRSLGERGVLIVRELNDWYSLPGSSTPLTERPQAHGSFVPGLTWQQSASFEIVGWFMGVDRAAVRAAKTALAGAMALTGLLRVTVDDGDESTSRLVSVREASMPDDHGRDRFTFSIACVAPDPRRYGVPQIVTGPVVGPYAADNLSTNPSFQASAAGWVFSVDGSADAPLNRISQAGAAGTGYGQVTLAAAATRVVAKHTVALTRPTVADTLSVAVRANTVRPVRLAASILAGTQVLQTISQAASTSVGPVGWTRLALSGVVIPSTATSVVVAVDSLDAAPWVAGDVLQVDAARVGTGAEYADGDTAGWFWEGTPGASVSVAAQLFAFTNPGTAAATPYFTVVGVMPGGFSLFEVETGREVQFIGSVAGAAPLTFIDPYEGVVTVDDSPAYGLRKLGWPSVPPGATRTYRLVPALKAKVSMAAELAPAWW